MASPSEKHHDEGRASDKFFFLIFLSLSLHLASSVCSLNVCMYVCTYLQNVKVNMYGYGIRTSFGCHSGVIDYFDEELWIVWEYFQPTNPIGRLYI